jgi:hypothetical protein
LKDAFWQIPSERSLRENTTFAHIIYITHIIPI